MNHMIINICTLASQKCDSSLTPRVCVELDNKSLKQPTIECCFKDNKKGAVTLSNFQFDQFSRFQPELAGFQIRLSLSFNPDLSPNQDTGLHAAAQLFILYNSGSRLVENDIMHTFSTSLQIDLANTAVNSGNVNRLS